MLLLTFARLFMEVSWKIACQVQELRGPQPDKVDVRTCRGQDFICLEEVVEHDEKLSEVTPLAPAASEKQVKLLSSDAVDSWLVLHDCLLDQVISDVVSSSSFMREIHPVSRSGNGASGMVGPKGKSLQALNGMTVMKKMPEDI